MGIMISPLVLTSGFLTGAPDLSEADFPPNVLSPSLPTQFHHTHPVKESTWRKYQDTGCRISRVFQPKLQAARPLKISPTIMPPHIIDDIKHRRDETHIDRPYAPSPLPPEAYPPGYKRPESQHHANIDGDSDETGERGIVIIDFEI